MELKELLAEFDIQPEDVSKLTVEEVRKLRDEKWIGRAVVGDDDQIVSAITGKALGSIQTALKGALKEINVELTPEEIKGKKVEEIIRTGMEKAKFNLEELKKKGGEGGDKKLTDALKTLEEEKAKRKETEDMLKKANDEIAKKDKEFQDNVKTFKLQHKVSEIKGKIPYSDTADEFKKRGFEAVFSENYKVELGENDEVVLLDKNGKSVKNPTGTAIVSYEDKYKEELDKAGMLKKNNVDPKKTTTTTTTETKTNGSVNKEHALPVGMQEHMDKLNGKS